jgi:type I restriction enzyme, S subunit
MPGKKDKSHWPRVAFGDVVQLSKERFAKPEKDGFDRFVGLEHLEPCDLKIRRWGNVADGTTFTSVFRAGQTLFGKRRAYQRKVGVPDFDGVCSGDIYVLEPKDHNLLPELLPFICQTDRFFEHAVGTSAGSLSPRTNWKSLADFEFALPPLEEQRRIAEVLGAAEEYREMLSQTQVCLHRMKRSAEVEVIYKPLRMAAGSFDLKIANPIKGWLVCSGQELLDKGYLCALQDGNHGSQYPRSSELGDEGLPYISASDISEEGDIDLENCRRIRPERAAKLRIPPAMSGDVILTNNATVGRVTRLPEWPSDIVASTSTTYYRCNEAMLHPDYLRWFFESSLFQFQLATIMRQSTRSQVPITTQKRLLFAIPPRDEQEKLAAQRLSFSQTRGFLTERKQDALRLQKRLLENIL